MRPQVRDDEQRRPLQPVAAQPVEQVAAHRRQRRRRDPVEHHRDGRPALDGALQHPPRQRVAVPGGGRDEEPQVGRLEQPVRRLPVRLQHRVEVRGVQQRDPARHAARRRRPSRTPGPGGARAAPSSSGLCTSTGRRVVGRSTPAVLTSDPTNEFTSVDLPAPVDPETTTTAGADSSVRRGTRCSPSWSTSRARDARADAMPVDLQREPGALHVAVQVPDRVQQGRRRERPREDVARVGGGMARVRGQRLRGRHRLHWRGAGLCAHATIVAVRSDLAKRATRCRSRAVRPGAEDPVASPLGCGRTSSPRSSTDRATAF